MSSFNNWQVYDFYNMQSYMKKYLHTDTNVIYDFRYIKDIANTKISMWSYKNIGKAVPDLTDTILETALLFGANLCFYNSSTLGWILAYYTYSSNRSIYNTPTYVNIVALNGSTIATEVPYKDLILVKDNRMDIVPFIVIQDYIEKMKWIEGAMDKVLTNTTLPLAIIGSKKQASALKQVAEKIGNNTPYIIGDDNILDQIKGFNIDVPVQPQDIYDLRIKYKNECLSSLGIYNVDAKRERIVTQELVNKNDFADYVYQSCKMERQRFCKELSAKTDINVELIETYDINYDENVELESDKNYEIEKAKAEGAKDGNPNANVNVGGINNG